MKLNKLLKNLDVEAVHGPKNIEITGICTDSRRVSPGNLFIARRGESFDGSEYISEAVAAGASAVATDIYNPSLKEVTQMIHPKVDEILAALAATYYRFPSEELFTVGITGTKGKTTTAYLAKHLLENLYGRTGLIGTIEYLVGENRYEAAYTTPDVVTSHRMLYEMVHYGCKAAVMEVSSHGLDQNRVGEIQFDVGVFTSFSNDHLDYHKTEDNYFSAKAKLFRGIDPKKRKKNAPGGKKAVINADSPRAEEMIEHCQIPVFTYSLKQKADLTIAECHLTPQGTAFKLHYQGRLYPCSTTLMGRHNVSNILAAIAVAMAAGYPLEEIVPLIPRFGQVPGRLEAVSNSLGIHLFVDFAHTEDSMREVLSALNEVKTGKMIIVFGAGGDRDPGRRAGMGKVVDEIADLAVITSDNPRSEHPEKIIDEIKKGFRNDRKYLAISDRKEAIEEAVRRAQPGDIVLIAGKGHEKTQIFAHTTVEFDDCQVAKEACEIKIPL